MGEERILQQVEELEDIRQILIGAGWKVEEEGNDSFDASVCVYSHESCVDCSGKQHIKVRKFAKGFGVERAISSDDEKQRVFLKVMVIFKKLTGIDPETNYS